MKKEMKMMPNGNYDEVICSIQHECSNEYHILKCIEYGWDLGKLHLKLEDGDPYEDGYAMNFIVKYCPFCGYHPKCKADLHDENS